MVKGKRKAAKRRTKTVGGSRRRRKVLTREQRRARRTAILKAAACVLVLFACLFLAIFVGNSDYQATAIGWVPLIVVIAGIIGARVYLEVLKRGLKFMEKSDLGDCRRGEDVRFTVRFRNATPLFFFRIEAYFYVSDLFGNTTSEAMTTLALAPFEKYDLDFSARFDHIGTYSAGLKKVIITDYLRLFTATIVNESRRKVQVTPKLQPVEHIEFSNEAVLESTKAAKSAFADSMDYASVREYVPGDPLKTIHWKLSARSEHYLTRLFEVYANPGVSIIMDFYGPSNKAKTLMGMFDCVVETALSVGNYAQSQGMDTEIHYCNKYGERVRKVSWQRFELPQIIAEMPRVSNKPERQLEALDLLTDQMLSQYGQNNLIVCTANLSAQMISMIIEAKVRRREPLLFAVVPGDLVGRERKDWCASLGRLDAAGVGYVILSKSDELVGVGA